MAFIQTVEFAAVAGRNLTAKLYNYGSPTVVQTASVVTEPISSIYSGVFTDVPAGIYRLVATDDDASNIGIASYEVTLILSTTVFQAYEIYSPDLGTLENQEEILDLLAPIISPYPTQLRPNVLQLIRGDAYDDVSNSKLTWETSQNIDAASEIHFKIYDAADNIIIDENTSGVSYVYGGTTVTVTLTTAATLLLPDGTHRLDLEVQFNPDSIWTISNACVKVAK